ncbi:GSCOCT00014068001.2-RA-CDS [Cotesia congregata]|uniref:Olfactory receptor 33.1 n=1 Tax=Cotesia congregata TaxID=51543 RepID=A0A8J2HN02_COTCN|nr:GSCOCT00014068001.2-RA-CDS [Cotesia congregata]CAG5099809.1 olfactory receptor 33.1 [Cotesia congregata]
MFDKVKWIIEFLNAWPINPTKKKLIFFLLYLIHENVYLAMAYYDLFSIFGDLQLMSTNLIGTLVQMIMMIRLIFVKFSSRLRNVIVEIKADVCDENYQRTDEKIIYIKYSEMATNFYKITMGFELPYRAKLFNTNETTLKQSIFLYIYQAPMPITALCYFATVNMQFIIISNICARIAILRNRINQINDCMPMKTDSLIKHIVHQNLQEMFYICNWQEMSQKSKQSWLICMVSGAKIPMQITAGKIYIFSFNSFTGILRSSMAYVSLLRTLTA